MTHALAEAVGKALVHNHTLCFLRIGGHAVGCRGATAIASALTSNTTLTELSFAVCCAHWCCASIQ
jgi:hypothetical protein